MQQINGLVAEYKSVKKSKKNIISYNYIMNTNYDLVYMSEECKFITGYHADDFLKNNKLDFKLHIYINDIDKVNERREYCIQNRVPQKFTYRIFTKNGLLKKVTEKIELFVSENHDQVYIKGMVSESSTIVQNAINQSYINALNINNVISITDTDGKIVYVNENFCITNKFKRKEVIGKTHKIINSGFHDSKVFDEMWSTIKMGNTWRGEIKNKTKEGKYYWADSCIMPVFDDKENIILYVCVRNLITDKKISQANEKVLKQDLEIAESIGNVGSWKVNLQSKEIIWSQQTHKIFGYDGMNAPSFEEFLTIVYTDDRDKIIESWNNIFTHKKVDVVYRILVNNKLKWIKSLSAIERNELDNIEYIVGFNQDITEFVEKQNEVELKKKEIETIVQNIPVTISQLSPDFEIIYSNYDHENSGFNNFFDQIATEFHQQLKTNLTQVKQTKLSVSLELKGYDNNKNIKWYRLVINKVTLFDNKYDYNYLIVAREITTEKQFQENLIQATTTSEVKERERIAKELHDGICQNLVALKLMANKILKDHPKLGEENSPFSELKQLINTTLIDLRRCSYDLMPVDLERNGLFNSLKTLFALNNTATNIKHSLELKAFSEPDNFYAINIYRIVQEFLQNAHKHSKCTDIELRIHENKDHLIFKLSDNGIGFPKSEEYKSGLGVLSMLGRISNIGGTHNIITNSGEGVQLYFSIGIE